MTASGAPPDHLFKQKMKLIRYKLTFSFMFLVPLYKCVLPVDLLINNTVSKALFKLYLHIFLLYKRVKNGMLLLATCQGIRNLFHSLSKATTVGASICVFFSRHSTNPCLRGQVVNAGEPIGSAYCWTFATLSKLIHRGRGPARPTPVKAFNPLFACCSGSDLKAPQQPLLLACLS